MFFSESKLSPMIRVLLVALIFVVRSMVFAEGVGLDALPPAVPLESPVFGCRKVESVDPEDLRKLGRFAALPEHFESWRRRNCWPDRLDDAKLRTTADPTGAVITVDDRDAFVVGMDPDWIRRCPEKPGLRPRLTRVTGADLFAVKQRIAGTPRLRGSDILEIGFGRAETGEENLFALRLGTRDRAARVECFEDFQELVDKAAEALHPGS